jgi:hypothetical protein
MSAHKHIVLTAMMMVMPVLVSLAQNGNLYDAYKMLERGQLDSAKAAIEPATMHAETSKNAQTWYIRGFIYKEIYKAREINDKQSPSRDIAFASFKKSIELDTAKENKDGNIPSLRFLASKYFNDAASSLDTIHYPLSIKNFEKYKEVMAIIEPGTSMTQKDVEFNLAIASVYVDKYNSNRKAHTRFFELAKAAYVKVLSLEPNNLSANYHMGILYYNQAVDIINQSEYDIDIVALDQIQDNSISLFKQSLPFMVKAYELDPNKKETLEGLTGIYFSLNEFEKSNEFKQKLEEIKNQK